MKLFDVLQVALHRLGMHRLATYAGRMGTQAEHPRLVALEFDPTFNKPNVGIDVAKDLAFPVTKLDVN